MSFTVVWRDIAESELAHMYLEVPDREAVRRAADRIEFLLRRDPLALGKAHFGSHQLLRVPPLGVEFLIDELDRRVTVVAIWNVGFSEE